VLKNLIKICVEDVLEEMKSLMLLKDKLYLFMLELIFEFELIFV